MQTTLVANNEATTGANLDVQDGSTTYVLPAPPGHWVPASRCEVWRQGCPNGDEACKAARESCKLIYTSAELDGSHDAASACRPTTFNQPCDLSIPGMLGQYVYVLPHEPQEGLAFPYTCNAGIRGSNGSDVHEQTSYTCAGFCPPGFVCEQEATIEPTICPIGCYCPVGSSIPRLCLPGTHSNHTGLKDAMQCAACPPGSACPAGSVLPTTCQPGSVSAGAGAEKCEPCALGTFQEAPGQQACDMCRAGRYCPVGSSVELLCPDGHHSNTTGLATMGDCKPCPPGTACAAGSVLPTPCQPGSVSAAPGAKKCEPCPQGTFQAAPGQQACDVCSVGHVCPKGSSVELLCPPGHYSNTTGLATTADCKSCPPGTACAAGSTWPTACAAGTVSAGTTATRCEECVAGSFQPHPGQTACVMCSAGSFSTNVLSCEQCPVGEWCPLGAVKGERCPSGFTTANRGAASAAACGCYLGTFEVLDIQGLPNCAPCPTGATCDAIGTKLATLPLVKGYWRQSSTSYELRPCFMSEACLGGPSVGKQCAAGHWGPYCSLCEDGYVGSGGLCQPCGGIAVLSFLPGTVLGACAAIALVYLTLRYCHGGKMMPSCLSELIRASAQMDAAESVHKHTMEAIEACATRSFPRLHARLKRVYRRLARLAGVQLRILISLFQMISGIDITYAINWPTIYYDMLRVLGSIVQLDLPKAMPLECIFGLRVDFAASLVLFTAAPLALILLFIAAAHLLRRAGKPTLAAMCSSWWFIILYLVCPRASSLVGQAFLCDWLPDGTPKLRMDYSVTCWEGQHLATVLYASIMALIYPIGTPLLYFGILLANMTVLKKIERAEKRVRAHHALDWQRRRSTTGSAAERSSAATLDRQAEEAIAVTGRRHLSRAAQQLTAGLRMECYWYEPVDLMRKLALTSLPIFLPMGSASQLVCGLLVCMIFAMLQAYLRPYVEPRDNNLALVCHLALFFALVSSIILKMERDSSAEVLGVVLVITSVTPPVMTFLVELGLGEGLSFKRLALVGARSSMCLWRLARRVFGSLQAEEAALRAMATARESSMSTTLPQAEPSPPTLSGQPELGC